MREAAIIVFCCDPLDRRHVDPEFAGEWEAALAAGFEAVLVDLEDLVNFRDPNRAVSGIHELPAPVSALYRGWMLTPNDYERLYAALSERNVRLITKPAQYKLCHYLPEAYPFLDGKTPYTVWLPAPELTAEALIGLLRRFGESAILVKDYVKSRKYEWSEACFIPKASDTRNALRIIHRFLELQGDGLNGGIVLRAFQKLAPLNANLAGGLPLSQEWRVFVFRGSGLGVVRYWQEGAYSDVEPDLSTLLPAACQLDSPFFSVDVARLENGNWTIVEVGDGQVSNLLGEGNATPFYRALREKWPD